MRTIIAPEPPKQKSKPQQKNKPTYNVDDVKAASRGRWAEIITTLAGIGDDYLNPGVHGPCPKCGGTDRWNFTNLDDEGGAICNQCGKFGDGLAVLMWALGIGFPDAVDRVGDYLKIPPSEKRSSKSSKKANGKSAIKKPELKPLPEEVVSLRHRIYSRLAELCGLSDDHRSQLRERGLTDDEIDRIGYFTADNSSCIEMKIHAEYKDEFEDISRHVPGVFPGRAIVIKSRDCLMIPARNADGNIIAIETKPDDPSKGKYKPYTSQYKDGGKIGEFYPTPGTIVHFALPAKVDIDSADTVRFTEGPLKADVAASLSGVRTIGVAGVGNWKHAIDAIESSGSQRLLLAFDADHATNKDVAKSIAESYEYFSGDGSPIQSVAIETWPADQGKGVDDALAAGAEPRVIEGEEAREFVSSLAVNGSVEIKIPINDPARLAEENLASYRAAGRDIRHWRERWYTYKGQFWEPKTETYIRARIRGFIENRFRQDCEESTERWEQDVDKGKYESDQAAAKARPKKLAVTGALVRNVTEAVQSICILPDHIDMGCLLPDKTARNLWAGSNGLLNLDKLAEKATQEVLPHTSSWFSSYCHDYEIDFQADCPNWIQFLDQVFWNRSTKLVDTESIDTLQRWFGYCLMDHIRLQKMLILDGVSRSGKGVIARVLKHMVGECFTASPKLKDFAGDFGLQPLLNKRLTVIGDAKLDRYRHDTESILETLLAVVGEDSIDVNVKRMDAATSTKLKTKFLLLCNGIPTLNDPAMAIVNRVVILKFNNSFAGKEDFELTKKLLNEMAGIFQWSLVGFCRVYDDHRLPQPESGREALENFKRAVSPIRGFVEECCHLRDMDDPNEPEYLVHRDDLYDSWIGYCHECGRDHPGTRAKFLQGLMSAYPFVSEVRPREEGERPRKLVNIELAQEGREKLDQKRDRDKIRTLGE
ncbi:hypothetical protein Q31b_42030 [Novipirellula aureliae]|uniref:SF3 helicase domain-containing protein n=1 Tax=Novipirellula aureliae TaxID=2527966 RepID=A0A5C6DQL3_9BACT|nr:phage/plasmid primase, P4 family [Novipirellula aureliae]TWU39120.1 hypothetical protein Q31b_42030 [Novipirellula aureliae]